MKKLLVLLFCLPLLVNSQNLKEIFKFGTVYGAVNGGTSLSDEDIYSVTNGLQSAVNETPYDYSILFGVRKMKQFGYQPKEAFKRGLESSFSDASTLGNWENNFEFLFQGEYKRQQGETYLDQHHFIRYAGNGGSEKPLSFKRFVAKIEYLEDGFADIKYFEASERLTYIHPQVKNLTLNIGAAQRLAEPYGYDPLAEWLLSNGNIHYTNLAIQEGYEVIFDGQGGVEYLDPSGAIVATSNEIWEGVVIPEMLAAYTERKRDELDMTIQHSIILGFDYYHYTKTFWLHSWGNLMPYHLDLNSDFSYHEYNEGQWVDYSGGLIFGYKFNKSLGVFLEGKYNKYWNRNWHDFSVGVNYIIF